MKPNVREPINVVIKYGFAENAIYGKYVAEDGDSITLRDPIIVDEEGYGTKFAEITPMVSAESEVRFFKHHVCAMYQAELKDVEDEEDSNIVKLHQS